MICGFFNAIAAAIMQRDIDRVEQQLPKPFPTFLRREKQHLQAPILDAHKPNRLLCFGNDQMLHAFQRLRHIRPDCFYFRV